MAIQDNKSARKDIKGLTLYKKWSFPLRISPINVAKSAVSWKWTEIILCYSNEYATDITEILNKTIS